jgi:hypothetical protein
MRLPNVPRTAALAASFLAGALVVAGAGWRQAEPPKDAPAGKATAETAQQRAMREAMEKAATIVKPGANHKALERFLGTWDVSVKMSMGGAERTQDVGTATWSWLMPGRWLKAELDGTLMGMPFKGFQILGYDNFKQSFVWTGVSGMDTAMTHAEGDMDPGDKALILYGTLDEYLTGEHDKMVKYLYRFESPDRMTLEVHDLPIGERNTKVLEFVFVRKT